MMRVSSSEYRELMDDAGAPTIRTLRESTRRTRTGRTLNCGHTLKPGQAYGEWVGLIDGEFTVQHDCPMCWEEMMRRETDAQIAAMPAEEPMDEGWMP